MGVGLNFTAEDKADTMLYIYRGTAWMGTVPMMYVVINIEAADILPTSTRRFQTSLILAILAAVGNLPYTRPERKTETTHKGMNLNTSNTHT